MSQSEFGKIVKLAKRYFEEEKKFGQTEVLLEKPMDPIKSANESSLTLDEFCRKISKCKKCALGKTRLNFVFGAGSPKSKVMFVGEGPGYEEDHKGVPFVGRAGELLTKIIESIGLKRENVYITNIVKCHPMVDPSDPEKRGNDRPPAFDEINICIPYLKKQIEIIKPKIICTLGNWAAKALLNTEENIGKLRGRLYNYNNIRLIATYHPAALLRNASLKKDVWEDMKKLRSFLCLQK